MQSTVTILSRFCGPPNSGNGGYVCGLLSGDQGDATEVTLKLPPPLDIALQLIENSDNTRVLKNGDAVVAEARPASLELCTPTPPTYEDALAAQGDFAGFSEHLFPRCFVCGPARSKDDGLHVFAAQLQDSPLVAAAWTPDATLTDETGLVQKEFLWAALDCPGYFALRLSNAPALLGRMTANILSRPHAGDRCVVIGWEISREGRKHISGTALFGANGSLHGHAVATWITLKKT